LLIECIHALRLNEAISRSEGAARDGELIWHPPCFESTGRGGKMRNLIKDLRYSVRSIFKNPGFSLSVVLILAIAMGPNAAIFTLLDAVIFHPAPYKEAEKLLVLNETDNQGGSLLPVSYPNFEEWRTMSRSFSHMAAYRTDFFNLREGETVERLMTTSVSLDFFPALGVAPLFGRTLAAHDFKLGSPIAVVISHGYWERRFAARPDICGTEVVVDGQPGMIVGVMPRNFRSFSLQGRGAGMWVPLIGRDELTDRSNAFVEVVARPRRGVQAEAAREEMEVIAARIASQYPASNSGRGVRVQTIRQLWLSTVGAGPRVLALLVLAVLLVACANVANLVLANGVNRRKEMALRRALGATRLRLVHQLLTESLVLGVVGAAAALVLAYWALQLINRFSGDIFMGLGIERFELDWTTVQFSIVLGFVTAMVFGVIPAWRTSKVDLNSALKEGGASRGSGVRKSRLAKALVVSELTVACVLLVTVGLYIRTYSQIMRQVDDPGFRVERVVTGNLSVAEQRFPTPASRAQYFSRVLGSIEDVAGVESVGLTSTVPGVFSPARAKLTLGIADDSVPVDKLPGDWVDCRVVSPGYFKALQIPLLTGRAFNDFDHHLAPRVALVGQQAASAYWKSKNPIGEVISINGTPHTIIGVMGDVTTALRSINRQPLEVAVSYLQDCPTSMQCVIHGPRSPESLIKDVRTAVHRIGPNEAASNFQTMEQFIDHSMVGNRFLTGLMASFAILGCLIAAAGVYGIMSHFTSQRTAEIGIRMALGARRTDVLRQIMRQGLNLILIGLGIGLTLSVLLSRVLPTVMFGTVTVSPFIYLLVVVLLALVAMAACYFPARRASKVNPIVALRVE